MTTATRLNGDDRLRQQIDEAELQIRNTLSQLREHGIKGVSFDARIDEDGGISVAVQESAPRHGLTPSPLAICEPRDLPLRAIVGFSSRCARRVLPFFLPFAVHPQAAVDIDRALSRAEGYANETSEPSHPCFDDDLMTVKEIGHALNFWPASQADDSAVLAASHALSASYLAICAVGDAVGGNQASLLQSVRALMFEASIAAAHAAETPLPVEVEDAIRTAARRKATEDCNRAMATDYQNLLGLELGDFPTPGKPIDPSAKGPLGPLWPAGEPTWFREGIASGVWETLEQVKADLLERQKIAEMTPPHGRLLDLAKRSPPAASWFQEENPAR